MPVYFIQDEIGEIKIGYSDGNPYGRLRTFQTGNPRELKMLVSIPGGLAEEQALHARFAELRGKGEWFKPDARMLGFIEALQNAHRDQQPEPLVDDPVPFSDEQLVFLDRWLGWRERKRHAQRVIDQIEQAEDHGGFGATEIEALRSDLTDARFALHWLCEDALPQRGKCHDCGAFGWSAAKPCGPMCLMHDKTGTAETLAMRWFARHWSIERMIKAIATSLESASPAEPKVH